MNGQVVHYADREKPTGNPKAVTIGEIDGQTRERTHSVAALFQSAGVPVDITQDIDGWLKYHAVLVTPLACALYKHDCDTARAAGDVGAHRAMVRAVKEGGSRPQGARVQEAPAIQDQPVLLAARVHHVERREEAAGKQVCSDRLRLAREGGPRRVQRNCAGVPAVGRNDIGRDSQLQRVDKPSGVGPADGNRC